MQSTSWKMVVAFVAGSMAALFAMVAFGPASGTANAATDGGNPDSLILLASDVSNGAKVLFLVDPKVKVLSVYEYDPRKSKLKLSAARHYAADHQLLEYNNEPPNVADIEKLVKAN